MRWPAPAARAAHTARWRAPPARGSTVPSRPENPRSYAWAPTQLFLGAEAPETQQQIGGSAIVDRLRRAVDRSGGRALPTGDFQRKSRAEQQGVPMRPATTTVQYARELERIVRRIGAR